MVQISLSELKTNTGKYVTMVDKDEVYITKNGKLVAKLVSSKRDKIAAVTSLFDILPAGTDPEAAKLNRFA